MSKPLYFLVWVDGVSHRFSTRKGARCFAAIKRMAGCQVTIKPVGFEA